MATEAYVRYKSILVYKSESGFDVYQGRASNNIYCPRGLMDKASASGAGDSGFESLRGCVYNIVY